MHFVLDVIMQEGMPPNYVDCVPLPRHAHLSPPPPHPRPLEVRPCSYTFNYLQALEADAVIKSISLIQGQIWNIASATKRRRKRFI